MTFPAQQGDSKEKLAAMEAAEEAREKEWKHPSFLGELFSGRARLDLMFPFPEQTPEDQKAGDDICRKTADFLKQNLNPDEVDRTGDVPQAVLDGLARLGCFVG